MKHEEELEEDQDRMIPVSTSTTLRAGDTLSLAELRCPKCGHKGSFVVEASECLLFHAAGSVLPGDCGMEWGDGSYCRCHACDHAGTVGDFRPESAAAPKKELYHVGIREVHMRHFNVQATSPEEAKALVADSAPEAIDLEDIEYIHELGTETWDARPISDTAKP